MTWPFEDIVEVHRRWYELTDTGIEIFLINGKTCLLALKSQRVRYLLIKHARLLYICMVTTKYQQQYGGYSRYCCAKRFC